MDLTRADRAALTQWQRRWAGAPEPLAYKVT